MTGRERISVCMAAHNGERYIKDQLKSILCSAIFHGCEVIIVVSDASHDRTPEIIEDLHDHRIHVIRHDVNKGVLAALREPFAQLRDRSFSSATRMIYGHPIKSRNSSMLLKIIPKPWLWFVTQLSSMSVRKLSQSQTLRAFRSGRA